MSKAQELATLLEKMKSEGWSTQGEDQAATLLRTQDVLLRQALEALVIADNVAIVGAAYTPRSIDLGLRKIREASTAIKEHLK